MIHLRDDDEIENSKRHFACGIGPELPEGDLYLDSDGQAAAYLMTHPEQAHCVGCFGPERPALGTPIRQLSGQPEHPGYEEFCRIARSWGHD